MVEPSAPEGLRLRVTACRVLLCVLVSQLLITGCTRSGTTVQGVPVSPATASRGELSKRVQAKRAPDELMAPDGTMCRVSRDRFRDTRVGGLVYCDWQ